MSDAQRSVLEMTSIVKTYGGVHALRGVDLVLERGSAHALVGENGAGKSTLIKIMTGATAPTSGSILVEGRAAELAKPEDARALGIVAVYQEVSVLETLSVAENLLLGREPTRWGLVDRARMNEEAREMLVALGLELDPRRRAADLPIALRQLVTIARGVSLGTRVLVLDEPTSSLSADEVTLLFDAIARVRARGTAVVYISHRFDEIDAVCDTVTVLRDGERVATWPVAGLSREQLVASMLGRPPTAKARGERDALGSARRPSVEGPVVLLATDLAAPPALRGVSLAVHEGELVGLAGLLGSGRTETARAIFGADPLERGRIEVAGAVLTDHGPRDAIAAGVAFLSEDRGAEGIVPDLSVRENLTLAVVGSLGRFGVLSRSRERALVDVLVRRLRIKIESPRQKIRELSGGNQQKVLLARWICTSPRLLLADEPTRGIDIGAKAEVFAVLREMREAGVAIVMIDSELEELAAECARIVVLRDGARVAELTADGGALDPSAIVQAIAGEER